MLLSDLYDSGLTARVADLEMRDPWEWPLMSVVLDRCVDRLVAILALFESGSFGDGWGGDIATLSEMAAHWTCLADALRIVEGSYESSGPNGC